MSINRKALHSFGRWIVRCRPEDGLAAKARFADDIRRAAKNGKIKIIESGMDCDCVQYSGRVYRCPATVVAANQIIERIYAEAEGPVSWRIASPDEKIVYSSRDLAAEAHEDGHPHVVYM